MDIGNLLSITSKKYIQILFVTSVIQDFMSYSHDVLALKMLAEVHMVFVSAGKAMNNQDLV